MHRRALLAFAATIVLLAASVGPAVGGVATPHSSTPAAPAAIENPCTLAPAVPSPDERGHRVGVATFGTLEAVHADGKNLQVVQEGMDDRTPAKGASKVDRITHTLPIGFPGNHLQVKVDDDTVVCIGGEESSMTGLGAIVGKTVLVAGTIDGASLKAVFVADLEASDSPLPEEETLGAVAEGAGAAGASGRPSTPEIAASTLSMCLGQDMDYDGIVSIKEFQGCVGGPSASGSFDLGIPFFCPFIGCFVLDTYSYTAALGGWGFDFPFQFAATGATPALGRDTLTYHVPGTITTQVTPKPATAGEYTFSGGLGLNIGLNVDFCSFWGCSNLGTINISAFSTIHQATGAGPLTGQVMDVNEVACPNIVQVGIDDIPFAYAIAVKACEDLKFTGKPFWADVTATASGVIGSATYGYGPQSRSMSVMPNGISVGVTYDDLEWTPDLDVGLYFKLAFLTGAWSVRIPGTIPLASGPFPAISNPFPSSGSLMTVATDPNSPVDALEYLYQPTSASVGLSVAPAPTELEIVSSDTVAVGEPVEARLLETWSRDPIAGETVTFTVGSATYSDATGADGIAHLYLPVGKYAIGADFAGTSYFEPASDSQSPVWVYLPTRFAIWGANPGGYPVGPGFRFWGSQWAKQVASGRPPPARASRDGPRAPRPTAG